MQIKNDQAKRIVPKIKIEILLENIYYRYINVLSNNGNYSSNDEKCDYDAGQIINDPGNKSLSNFKSYYIKLSNVYCIVINQKPIQQSVITFIKKYKIPFTETTKGFHLYIISEIPEYKNSTDIFIPFNADLVHYNQNIWEPHNNDVYYATEIPELNWQILSTFCDINKMNFIKKDDLITDSDNKKDTTITPQENNIVTQGKLSMTLADFKNEGTTTKPLFVFNKKDSALQYIQFLSDQTNKLLSLFQEDINNSGAKRFILMTRYMAFCLSKYYLNTNKYSSFYENYEADTPIKLFLDIDMPIDKIKIPQESSPNSYLNYIRSCCQSKFPQLVEKMSDDPIIILKASSSAKLSAHVIFKNIIFYAPCQLQKY